MKTYELDMAGYCIDEPDCEEVVTETFTCRPEEYLKNLCERIIQLHENGFVVSCYRLAAIHDY